MMATPREYVAEFIRDNRQAIDEIMAGEVNLRREMLLEFYVEPVGTRAREGLPSLYLVHLAHHDPDAFDLVKELLSAGRPQPHCIEDLRAEIESGALMRPTRRGRPPVNDARDFLLRVLVAVVQARFSELPFGANEATTGTEPATKIVLDALDDEGFEVIDGRVRAPEEDPEFRTVEKAIRRFEKNSRFEELRWN